MSIKVAQQLLSRLAQDEVLRRKLSVTGEKDFEREAAAAGFPCTLEELRKAAAGLGSGELSDQDLDHVAGGGSWTFTLPDGTVIQGGGDSGGSGGESGGQTIIWGDPHLP